MDLAGLSGLLVWGNESKWKTSLANIRYITDRILPGLLFFPREGDPVVWSGFPHGVKSEKVADRWTTDIRPGGMTGDVIETLKSHGLDHKNVGVVGFSNARPQVVPDSVLYQPHARILKALPDVTFSDASGLLDELRMIKSLEEIAMLEKASALSDAMYYAMVESFRPGVRECEVYADMLRALVAGGGEEDMIWLTTGAYPPPHASKPPSSTRVVEKGDVLVTEYHSNYRGYISGIEHSASIGEPDEEFKKIHGVCLEAQKRGIDAMRPGALLADVVMAFRKPIEDSGMNFIECGIHGHGLASPEFPSCMYGGSVGQWEWHPYAVVPPIELQENMVFGTASDVYNPDWKSNAGLMLGDTILISADGPRRLCSSPLELTVI
jgi:Xaa-Pro aminopeptidase